MTGEIEKEPASTSGKQKSQVSQVSGRNTELMFLCFTLSNLTKIECDVDIVKSFTQKLVEETERTELGYIGILKQVLVELWNQKHGDQAYTTEAGFVKVSNKEIYDRYNEALKKEYGQGVSPAKFKEFMLEFGFTDALNRIKLEVPIPSEPESKSRLCNVYTDRVLRKLGIDESRNQTLQEVLAKAKEWIAKNKNPEGLVDIFALTKYITSITEEKPERIIEILKDDGQLFDVPKLGKLGTK